MFVAHLIDLNFIIYLYDDIFIHVVELYILLRKYTLLYKLFHFAGILDVENKKFY